MPGVMGSIEDGKGANSNGDQFVGEARILGPKWCQLPALTIGLLGVQLLWSIEMSYASPYLISLGLSKSAVAMVFLAGPLSGLIVQPLVGAITDNSMSSFGRRRPCMLVGTVICAGSMVLLGFAREFTALFVTTGTDLHAWLTKALAVWTIYCMDFSVNAVQCTDWALLVDTLPKDDQTAGIAWSAGMLGIGGVVGFFIGNVDLTETFWMLGKTEMQVISVLGSILLVGGQIVTVCCVKERILVSRSRNSQGVIQGLKEIWENMFTLPHALRQIYYIQFCVSMTFFPILFYSTVYVGDIHRRLAPEPLEGKARDDFEAEGTYLGTRALFYGALVTMVATVVIPAFVSKSRSKVGPRDRKDLGKTTGEGARENPSFATFLSRFVPKVHMCELWAVSNMLLAVCMAGTWMVSTVGGATFLITVTGFPRAVQHWAPLTLMAEEIVADVPGEEIGTIHLSDVRVNRGEDGEELEVDVEDQDEDYPLMNGLDADDVDDMKKTLDASLNITHNPPANTNGNTNKSLRGKAGIILGIGNIFIVIPQFIVTGLSSVIFAWLEPGKIPLHGPAGSDPGNGTNDGVHDNRDAPNPVAVILRIGGVSAAVAFFLAWRLAKELKNR